MGRSAALKEPSFLVWALTSTLLAVSRIWTAASSITAPLLSVTVPLTVPKVCWPAATCARKASSTRSHGHEIPTNLDSEGVESRPRDCTLGSFDQKVFDQPFFIVDKM